MNRPPTVILLADDDEDDCFLFQEVLNELSLKTNLITVNNGIQLMNFLVNTNEFPDVLFLDMNMPCMNGLECLTQIRSQEAFDELVIIIYSTSYEKDLAQTLKNIGADFYIQKPSEFLKLKLIISKALQFIVKIGEIKPRLDTFILSEE